MLEIGGLLVFNVALLRAFGARPFVACAPWVHSWRPENKQSVVDAALDLFGRGEMCFTCAYGPARFDRTEHSFLIGRNAPK